MEPRLLRRRLACLSFSFIIVAALAAHAQSISFTSSPYPSGADKAQATLDVAYIYDANAEASNGSLVRYSLRFGPSGMSIDPRTGVIGWQPSQEGEFDTEIRAELVDDPSVNTTQTWKIAVSKPQGHPGCTGNDIWLPVGKGLPGPGVNATVHNNELYVLHRSTEELDSPLRISKWNGSYWSTLDEMSAIADGLSQMISFNGKLYATTVLGGIPNVPNLKGIARWDGTSWSAVGTHDFRYIRDMYVFNNELYVLGLSIIDNVYHYALAKWDDKDWEIIYEQRDPIYGEWGYALTSLNGKLYVSCNQQSFGLNYNELPLLELSDGTLKPVPNRGLDQNEYYACLNMFTHNGAIIMTTVNVTRWDGTKAESISLPPGIDKQSSPVAFSGISYDNQLYVNTWLDEGVFPKLIDNLTWRLNNDGWNPVSSTQRLAPDTNLIWNHMNFIEYLGDLYAYGVLDQSCGTVLNHIAVLGTEKECARVSGSVYHDDNRNCAIESGESTLAGELIEILPGPLYAMTDRMGNYTTLLRPGTYSLDVMQKRYWMNACPGPQEVTLASPAASVSDVNMHIDMIPGIYDVQTSLMIGQPRPGFDFTYTLTYRNTGTEPAAGKVIFEHDDRLAYQSSTITPNRRNANRHEWDFSNLRVGESVTITISLNVPSSMSIGTGICAFVDIELERKDLDELLSDNLDSICTTVRGSYDPNDIQVTPRRFDEELGDAPLLPGDTVISYLVRFQNTGNDTAFTVIVADTLDASLLDITSIRLGAASHDFDFDISGPGILTWTFNNILLPDSGVNELASHGYFKYMIHLRRGLAPLTQIPNHASIYFDYNAPVKTNTVVSITSGTLSVDDDETTTASLRVYPNPVRGTSSIRLNLTEREHVKLRLIDGSGDVITILSDKEMSVGEHTLSLDSRELSSGAYYLMLERNGIKEIYPVVVNR